jgi:O-antigen ligase
MATVHINLRNRSLPERIVYGVLLAVVLVLGFFFLVAALIAGAILAVLALARFWWVKRRLKQAADQEFITTEYSVIERERLESPPAEKQ